MKFTFNEAVTLAKALEALGVRNEVFSHRLCQWLYQSLNDEIEGFDPTPEEIAGIVKLTALLGYRDEDFLRFIASFIDGVLGEWIEAEHISQLVDVVWTLHLTGMHEHHCSMSAVRQLFSNHANVLASLGHYGKCQLYEVYLAHKSTGEGISQEMRTVSEELKVVYSEYTKPCFELEDWEVETLKEMEIPEDSLKPHLTEDGIWAMVHPCEDGISRAIEFGKPQDFFVGTESIKPQVSFRWSLLENQDLQIQFGPYWQTNTKLKPEIEKPEVKYKQTPTLQEIASIRDEEGFDNRERTQDLNEGDPWGERDGDSEDDDDMEPHNQGFLSSPKIRPRRRRLKGEELPKRRKRPFQTRTAAEEKPKKAPPSDDWVWKPENHAYIEADKESPANRRRKGTADKKEWTRGAISNPTMEYYF